MLRRTANQCVNGLTFLAAICLVLMMAQMALDVFLKYFFNSPIQGNLEVVSFYYMVGVVFLPLAKVEFRHEHFSVDLFTRMLPKRVQNYVYAAGSLISAAFFGFLTYQTFLDAVEATRIGEVMMGTELVTIWPSRWALPTGFFCMFLAVIIHAWQAIRMPTTFDPTPAQPELNSRPLK